MQDLKESEREHLKIMLECSLCKKKGYFYLQKIINKKRFIIKRSRAIMQLYLNKKLEIWEIVHHIDENKENDNIDNLEVINTKEFNFHTSMHHAGKRDRKTTKGDFYKKE